MKIDLINALNLQQLKIVKTIDGPVVIFAGAGSGKTRVITYRIAYLLSLGVSPENILAMTFTNKAAQEMKHRVSTLVPGKGEHVWISTFHSFCANFLYKESHHIGLPKNFVIYDESDQKQVIKECMKEMLIQEKELNVDIVKEMINRAKDNLIDSESYKINSMLYKDSLREIVSEIYIRYQEKLSKSNAVDFGDLIMKTVEILRTNLQLKEYYSNKYKYIHIDEYQDVNLAQAVLTKILASKHNNVCVVGDDDQAIYSWRGADVNYLLNFKKEFSNAKEFKLEQNYRSTKIILEIGNALIQHNHHRAKKFLWTENDNCSMNDVKIVKFSTEYEEARYVASQINSLKESYGLNSIAVFYRTNAQSRVFEEIFQSSGIPYKIFGSVGFYERQEIKDILAYLKILVNPQDNISLKRAINTPSRGIGDTSILYLETLAKEKNVSLWYQLQKVDETELTKKTKNSIWKFLSLYDNLKKYSEIMPPSEFIKYLLEKTEYLKMLEEKKDEYLGYDQKVLDKIANIEELISAAKNYEIEENIDSIQKFLTKVSLVTKDDFNTSAETETISLMTLHSAKGLEFDVVFITGLEERIFPVWWAINGHTLDIEEERRLCYVGITRARKKLFLTYSETRRLWGTEVHLPPSRFVNEITNFFEKISLKTEYEPKQNKTKFFNNVEVEGENISKIENLRSGEYVQHDKFGIGRVIDIYRDPSGDKVVVLFSDGEKRKLHLSYANLKKIK